VQAEWKDDALVIAVPSFEAVPMRKACNITVTLTHAAGFQVTPAKAHVVRFRGPCAA
jgi:hypothetical protein